MTDEEIIEDDANTVWQNTVDGGTWGAKVVRTKPYTGILTVWHVESGDEILSEEVGLMADALFGPDVDDVLSWQEKAIDAIDQAVK